jgi:ATPase family AAA domain-containing protein 3A/B
MENRTKISLGLISILSLSASCYAGGQRPDAFTFVEQMMRHAGEAAHSAAQDIDQMMQQQKRAQDARVHNLEGRLGRRDISEAERLKTLDELARERASQRAAENIGIKVADAGVEIGKQVWSTGLDIIKQEYGADIAKRQALITAEKQRQGMVDRTKLILETATKPENAKLAVLTISAAALGVFAAKHGTSLAAQMISHWYKIPTLAQETSLMSWRERVSNFVYGIKPPTGKLEDVVLESKLQARVTNLAEALKNTIKNGGYLKNILFYGPPGTGKTMLAKRLAYTCGLEYIYFAASDLEKMSLDLALGKLSELFEFAKKSSKKLMIIIDEAEILFADRSKNLSENTRKLLTHILTYTGTETQDYMVMALTNRPEDLDSAFLSRCADQIKIDAPATEQRREILLKYIDKYLMHPEQQQPKSTSLLGRFFGTQQAPKAIAIQDGIVSDTAIEAINVQLEGFVGRDISQLVLEWQSRAYGNEGGVLTPDIINDVVTTKVEQKKAQSAGFGKRQLPLS